MMIRPPYLHQGQFWYKADGPHGSLTVLEIMLVTSNRFQYRVWHPMVKGMCNTVGRHVEWRAPYSTVHSENWYEGIDNALTVLTHRLLMGGIVGFRKQR